MMRAFGAISLLVAVSATRADQAQSAPDTAIVMQGIDLYLFSSKPTFGEVEDPTFWVHAERGQELDRAKRWSIENARAVVYREPEEDLLLTAKSGIFDEQDRAAELTGGVRVTSGTLVVDLEDIAWDDAARVATSDSELTLNDGVNQITGKSIAIYPDEDRVEVGGGSATIQLAQAKTEAGSGKPSADRFEKLNILENHGITGNLKGAPIEVIHGPVHMVLIGKNPDDTLTIKAGEVRLGYSESGEKKTPSRVSLKGKVEVVQAKNSIRADDAEIDFESGKARFTGDVHVTGADLSEGSGPSLDLNLDTGEYRLGGPGGVVTVDLTQSGEESDAP